MSLIRRPLTGGSALGSPFAIAAAPGTVIHAFDQTGTALGGPFPQRITLFAQNPTGGALTLTVTINGVALVKALASGDLLEIFDSQPMFASGAAAPASQIIGSGSGAGVIVWGFVETQT